MKRKIASLCVFLLLSTFLLSSYIVYGEILTPETPTFNSEFRMNSIQVNGQNIEGFNPDQFDYIVVLPESQIPTNSNDLLNMVDGQPMDSEAFVGKFTGEDPNTVLIRPYVNFEFSSTPYTITIVPEGSTNSSSSSSIPDKVRNFNSNLKAINTETMTSNNIQLSVLENLQNIKKIILMVNDPITAEKVYDLLSETMMIVGRLMPHINEKNLVTKEISGITNNSRKLTFLIERRSINGDLTLNYFRNMKLVLSEIEDQEYETKNLKNMISDLANQAVSKTSQYKTPEESIKTSNGVGKVKFILSDISDSITPIRNEFNKINGGLINLLGYNNPRNIKPQLTLYINNKSEIDFIEIEIEKTLLKQIALNGYTDLRVISGEASLKFSSSLLLDSEDSLFVNIGFLPNSSIKGSSSQLPISDGKIVDITMRSNTEDKTKFLNPIELEFDLNQWNLDSFSNDSLNNLSFFVLNEDTKLWEVVGGNYDPVTRTIRVMRMSLSKYTVMQSNKSFSDLEYAWAKDEINELLGKGIVEETVTFNPKNPVSRKDFTVWVSKAYGLNQEDIVVPFEDILKTDPFFVEVSTAYSMGIINGKSSTSFDPNGNITREEISTIVSNALTKFDDKSYNPQIVDNLEKYSDFNEISGWAQNTVSLVDELGIMRGDDVTFRPKDNVTRQEAASIVKRIYN